MLHEINHALAQDWVTDIIRAAHLRMQNEYGLRKSGWGFVFSTLFDMLHRPAQCCVDKVPLPLQDGVV